MRYGWLLIPFLMAGCMSHKYTPVKQFVLEPQIQAKKTAPTDKTLGIRPFEAARPYRQPIAHRDPDYVLGTDENFSWAELPATVVTHALTDALAATHHFKDVGDAANLLSPNLILTGQLRRFDEDRTTDPWTAVVEIHLSLRDQSNPDEVWSSTLSAKEPLRTNDVAALPAAMSKAVSEVVNKAANEIAGK